MTFTTKEENNSALPDHTINMYKPHIEHMQELLISLKKEKSDLCNVSVETKLDTKLSSDNKIPNVLHNNKYIINLRNNFSINSIAKTCWTNLDKSNLDKLGLIRQPELSNMRKDSLGLYTTELF